MKEAKIDKNAASPELWIDGTKIPPVIFALSDVPGAAANTHYAYRNIQNFAKAGIDLVGLDVELRNGWFKHSPYEWDSVQAEIADALEANPNGKMILRLHMNAPYWWSRDYPEENAVYRDHPVIDDGEQYRLIRNDKAHHLRVSFASQRWLKEAGENLKILCEKVWNTPEGEAVAGIQVAIGVYGECLQWGEDRSQPMIDRFHLMLKEKYGTEEALQKAWNNPSVTFENAHFVPENDQRYDEGIFRDPKVSQDILDSQMCLHVSTVEAILHFSRIIKENWGRPVLVGAFYGSYINAAMPCGGKLLAKTLLDNRQYIDYFSAPFPYVQNRQADSVPIQKGMLESCRLNGMLWLTEMDRRPQGIREEALDIGDPALLHETIALMQRSVFQPILAGQGFWYYDHKNYAPRPYENHCTGGVFRKKGWWDNAPSMQAITQLQRVFEAFCQESYTPRADVLLVYSPFSYMYAKDVHDQYKILEAVAKAGVAYDSIYVDDLEKADLDRYRCVIFPDALYLGREHREMIGRCLKEKQVMYLYAPGYADEEALDVGHMEEVMGMHLKKVSSQDTMPQFEVCDPDAQIREMDGGYVAVKGHVWYSSTLTPEAGVVTAFIDQSGAHRYNDTADPVLAGNDLVAVYSYPGGRKEVNLKNGKKVVLDMPPISTALIDAGSGEVLLRSPEPQQ